MQLTLREHVAQLVFARIGSNMDPAVRVEEDEDRIAGLLERCPLGGLILFNGSVETTPDLLKRLQRRSRVPLFIASDIERGLGQQVRGGTVFPHAMAYSAIGTEGGRLLEQAARVTAREALACGIHIAFAPVADVNRRADNPIIATRAFSTEPDEVARLVRAYVRASREEGLLTTAKHFPGHGNTSEDSHETTPTVSSSREEIEATDLVPFRAAVEAGVDLVMTAHVSYPALDPSGRPATLSRPIIGDLLREEMRFHGLVISDSMLMGAVRDADSPDAVAAQAAALFNAGVDVLLDPQDPMLLVDGLVIAVEKGLLSEERVEQASNRVLALKRRFAARFDGDVFLDPPRHEVGSLSDAGIAETVAREAVRVLHGDPDRLPIGEGKTLVVLVRPFRTRLDPPEPPLAPALRALMPDAAFYEVGPEADAAHFERLAAEAMAADNVVVALVVKPAAWHTFGLLPAQDRFVRDLLGRRSVVLASLGTPTALDSYTQADLRLCAYSDVPASQRALAERLAGRQLSPDHPSTL